MIAGGGFGGAEAARRLERLLPQQSARIVLVNDVNFLLYTPLLSQAAAGVLEPRHVVTPLREILKRTYLRLGAVSAHDPARRTIEITDHDGASEEMRYDQLVLAVGSVSRLLPIPGLAEHGLGFKSLSDAFWLRNKVIGAIEAANASEDPARRERELTFVFVGGGYAGLEALAELQDFAAAAMDAYPRARLQGMRWILVEARDHVMPEIDRELAAYALTELRSRGIDVRLETTLEEVSAEGVRLSTGEWVPARTLVWTAGVTPHPCLERLSVPLDESGRVRVDDSLAVHGTEGVWALGDCAAVPNPDDGFCPPTAQHAIRQGRTAARNVAAALGVGTPARFTYRTRGAFVNLGRYKAVARVGPRTLSGFGAWWAARTYHVAQLPTLHRKVRAVADWTVGLPFPRDVAEVGSIGSPRPLGAEELSSGGAQRPVPSPHSVADSSA